MKITKLIVSIALCISLMSNSSVYAAYDETPDSYFYVYPDGQTIEYYLDDYGNPYTYLNGEKIGVFITLDRYKVTDQKTIDMLNSNRNLADTNINRSEPTTYYDISNGQIYPLNVDFISVSTWASETLKCGSNSKKFRVRTLPYVQRPFAPKKSVAINIYYYDAVDDSWSMLSYPDQDCATLNGWGWYRTQNYTYVSFLMSSNYLSSATVNAYLESST